jgi:hypothetical protein
MDFPKSELFEQCAGIEHQRWADWQKYYHSKCFDLKGIGGEPTGDMIIPKDIYDRAERQLNTKYCDLTEREKNSDREQVMRYWHLFTTTNL